MSYPIRLILFGVFSVAMLSTRVPAATIHVPDEQPTIQQAINSAVNGDIVLVSPGIYFEHLDFTGKAIEVRSALGPVETIIDGSRTDIVVHFQNHEGPQSVLSGFTIQHGLGSAGVFGGIRLILASPTITGNIFRENGLAFASGAAIDGNGSSPVIECNIFFGNNCDTQFSSGVVSFRNFSSPTIINNVFVRNPCPAITMLLPGGNVPIIANNTISHNSVGVRLDGRFSATQSYANNILSGNGIGVQVDSLIPGEEPVWTNNLVYLNTTNYSGIADQTGVSGNISNDPLFLPTCNRHTFQLSRRSPAVDAGLLIPGLPPSDFLGNPRVVDGNGDGSALPDIGAYEFIPNALGFAGRVDSRDYR